MSRFAETGLRSSFTGAPTCPEGPQKPLWLWTSVCLFFFLVFVLLDFDLAFGMSVASGRFGHFGVTILSVQTA